MSYLRLNQLLKERDKSLYWLAAETGMQYAGLWRMANKKTKGIQFETLKKICRVLECTPNDLLVMTDEEMGIDKS